MKIQLLLILTIFTFGISKATSTITAQTPDVIIFNGKKYDLNTNPLEPYFDKFPNKRPEGGVNSTNLWRGYLAYFEIIDKQLFVTDIEILIESDKNDEIDEYSLPEYEWVSVFEQVFPNKEKFKIDWYTGILILPHGKMIEYVHMGYASIYSKYWLLEIESGVFNEARKYNNKKFVKFKKRQYEEFKKTDEYDKLYNELKSSGYYQNDNQIDLFIADYIINYTSKFLTD